MLMLSPFWKTIEYYDQTGLFYVNHEWSFSLLDGLMPWFRESSVWIPLYLFLGVLVPVNFGKKGLWWIAFFILSVGLADQVSSSFFKPFFARLRPCMDPAVLPFLKLRIAHCSGAFSFTSSHAANHFALALFAVKTLKPFTGKIIHLMFAWAALIGYAQMYVGVHYPLDVLGGTAIGLCIGWLTATVFNRRVALQMI